MRKVSHSKGAYDYMDESERRTFGQSLSLISRGTRQPELNHSEAAHSGLDEALQLQTQQE